MVSVSCTDIWKKVVVALSFTLLCKGVEKRNDDHLVLDANQSWFNSILSIESKGNSKVLRTVWTKIAIYIASCLTNKQAWLMERLYRGVTPSQTITHNTYKTEIILCSWTVSGDLQQDENVTKQVFSIYVNSLRRFAIQPSQTTNCCLRWTYYHMEIKLYRVCIS